MSKRLLVTVISSVVMFLADQFGLDSDALWQVVSMLLGYIGLETVRPSGTKGMMGKDGAKD